MATSSRSGPIDDTATQVDPELRSEAGAAAGLPGSADLGALGEGALRATGTVIDVSLGLREGDRLDHRYSLIGFGPQRGPIGHGAFGEVWQAHDRKFDREVALKVLQPRVCGAAALLRFEQEKQTIARMEHPNIARVFDAGTFRDGRPFLAMELIRGQTLGEYVNERTLSLAERLRLFVPICRAVQHAHERFVLHRDLKPTNILVVEHDGQPVPKVIDFGIAKILEDTEFTAGASVTIEASVKGTPAYMSPEQTRGVGDLTVRSDIYTLGVILFELLTGDTPLSHQRSRKLDFVDLLSAIRDEEPMPPSASVTQTSAFGTDARGALRFRDVSRQLRGDLDVIVLRALQKNPARRYESVADLAADVERHLRHEPILARRPTVGYRVGKFLQRHQAFSIAAALVLLAVLATAVVSTRAYFAVRSSLDRETAAKQAAIAAGTLAQKKEAEAEQERARAETSRNAAVVARNESEELINYMLFDLRQQLEPLGRSRLLAGVSEQAEEYFAKQPAQTDDAALERNREVMFFNRGYILLAQGDTTRGLAAFQTAHDLAEQRARQKDEPLRRRDLAMSSLGLGTALRAAGRPDEARVLFERDLPELRAGDQRHETEATRLLASHLEQLGDLELYAGKAGAALSLFQEQEALTRRLRAAEPQDNRSTVALAVACEKVGEALARLGRPEEALPKFQEEVDLLGALAADHLDDLVLRRSYAVALEKLGNALLGLKRPQDARQRYEERLRESELLARVDPRRLDFRRDLAVAHQRLAGALLTLGDQPGALLHAQTDWQLTKALAEERSTDGALQEDLAASGMQVGLILLKTGSRAKEARKYLEQAADGLRGLAKAGKIGERGKDTLAELEKALAELGPLH